MVREIKFRGYSDGYNAWKYGFGVSVVELSESMQKELGVKEIFYLHTDEGKVSVVAESVGQYTGLKDKNGQCCCEIYEGDIVKGYYDEYNSFFDEINRHEFISEVKYIDNSFKVHRNTLNDEGRIRDYGYVHEWDSELVEVIGNIYENKELLVQENEE